MSSDISVFTLEVKSWYDRRMQRKLIGGIEAGGTKFICAVGSTPRNILDQVEVATTTPAETIEQVLAFFQKQTSVVGIGVGSFGPLDLDLTSPTYGHIMSTPKASWSNNNFVGMLRQTLGVPVALQSDVNAAALGELRYGSGKGLNSLVYMSVGTGVGIGHTTLAGGFQGKRHAEGGHLYIPRSTDDSEFISSCPYHTSCLEGLASGPALYKRYGVEASHITDSVAWEHEAEYLSYGVVDAILLLMPEQMVIGGGVMDHKGLLAAVQQKVLEKLNGYAIGAELTDTITSYLVSPGLGRLSGVTGALELAAGMLH